MPERRGLLSSCRADQAGETEVNGLTLPFSRPDFVILRSDGFFSIFAPIAVMPDTALDTAGLASSTLMI